MDNNKKHIGRHCSGYLKIFSTNAASVINGKKESLKSEITCTKANVVTLQETHARKKGKIDIPEFVVFEAIRTKKGGGTLIAAHTDLNPKLISEYNDEFELLVVEVETKNNSIRIISGYGPQENLEEEKRLPFFLALEVEIEKAESKKRKQLKKADKKKMKKKSLKSTKNVPVKEKVNNLKKVPENCKHLVEEDDIMYVVPGNGCCGWCVNKVWY